MTTTIVIPELIPGNNSAGGFKREHWSQYTKRRDRYQYTIMSQCRRQFRGKVTITLIRYSTGEMQDFDNLVSCGKPILDALVRAKIIEDDKMSVIGKPEYKQVKISRKEKPKYEIIITQ
jgi:Holliday junction resolvase RusA-like endonuclease